MEATMLTALVVAANRDDMGTRALDGPWATESPRRSRRRGRWSVLASALLALASRIVLRHREAMATRATMATN
jgi:hypothetical protein